MSYDVVGYRICTHLSISYHVYILATDGEGGWVWTMPQSPFQSSKLASCWQLHIEWIVWGWTWILIHLHGCNRPRWRGSELVRYTFLEIVDGDCMDGWSRSRHSKVPKQLAIDSSKLSERCKAGHHRPKVLYKHESLVSYLLAISFCSSTVEAGGDEGERSSEYGSCMRF